MPLIEVPAHVQHESFVQNKIQVVGGTNWDLSRTAVETPVTAVVEPVPLPPLEPQPRGYSPAQAMPVEAPNVVVSYRANSVLLSKQASGQLRTLTKKSRVLVAGHADTAEKGPVKLALRRAQAVAAQLKRQGHAIEAVRSFGDEVPRSYSAEDAALNRRVEVFER